MAKSNETQARPMGGGGMQRGMMGGAKAKNPKETSRRLVKYLRPYIPVISLVILFAVISTVFNVYGPKLIGKATTVLFEGAMQKAMNVPGAAIDFDKIQGYILTVMVLYIIGAVFNFISNYIMTVVAQRVAYNMRQELVVKLNKLPLSFFDSRTTGDTMSLMTNDIDQVSNVLQQGLAQFITSVATVLGIIVMMLTISWQMTLIAIISIPVMMILIGIIMGTSQKLFKRQQAELGTINGHIEEMYSSHLIVKAFNGENKSRETFDEINEKLFAAGWKAQFISGFIMPAMMFVGNINYVFVCLMGAKLTINGTISIGDIQAFIQYTRQITQPIGQISSLANQFQSAIAGAERVFAVLDEVNEVEEKDVAELVDVQGQVDIKNVHFGYTKEKTIINNFNLSVKPGQTIAIVGPTGAGKTTLINLLMRFYEVDSGSISVDGIDITNIKRSNLRNNIGMVLQDTWLYNDTIANNIGYGVEGATRQQIEEAAKMVFAHSFIKRLPNGYDSELNDEATNISFGQKQLLTIARAVLADPKILILDEATSNIDSRTEQLIQKAMAKLMTGRTSFVIAHRLSTIVNADLILVMNKGDVIEQGTHHELLEQKGFYADLYNSQFAK